MKHVVSVSLGAKRRDVDETIALLGQKVRIERRGTGGDVRKAAELIRTLDGRVDAIGLGGIDLYLYVGGRRYPLRGAVRLAAGAKETPVVCGAGLKDTLERTAIEHLESSVGWRGKRVLLVSALDRFGMAEALRERGADVLYGDAMFALGLPVPIRRLETLAQVAKVLLPVVTKLPHSWLYPVGAAQEREPQSRFARYYDWAEVVAGDWHFIKRYAPPRLDGKTILTNTTTPEDVAWLRARGVERLITTTPRFSGRSLATNLLEAALVALSNRFPLASEDYRELIGAREVQPTVVELTDEHEKGFVGRGDCWP